MDPIESAKKGDLQFFKTVYIEVLQNARDKGGRSALDWAVASNHQDCVEEICRRCPELVYYQNSYGATAAHWAASKGNIPMLAVLINTAIKVDLENGNIVGAGGRKITRMLDTGNRSSLWFAVNHGRLEMVKYLLEADPEFVPATNDESDTPLALARERAMNTTDSTIGNRYTFSIYGHDAEILYFLSLFLLEVKIAELLLEHEKYQIKLENKEHNWTTLQQAATRGDIDTVKKMIESSPKEMDLVDDEKRNFVHLAAQFGHTEIIKFLLEEADISARIFNAQDKYGNTPLHVAGLYGNISTATCLLYDSRVVKETLNSYGQNILDAVFASGREKARIAP